MTSLPFHLLVYSNNQQRVLVWWWWWCWCWSHWKYTERDHNPPCSHLNASKIYEDGLNHIETRLNILEWVESSTLAWKTQGWVEPSLFTLKCVENIWGGIKAFLFIQLSRKYTGRVEPSPFGGVKKIKRGIPSMWFCLHSYKEKSKQIVGVPSHSGHTRYCQLQWLVVVVEVCRQHRLTMVRRWNEEQQPPHFVVWYFSKCTNK